MELLRSVYKPPDVGNSSPLSVAQLARAEKRAKKKQNFITIAVTVEGMPRLAKAKPIEIKCCDGNQLVKWLALTVSQRIAGQKASGARRSHEHFNRTRGFIVPGEVVHYDEDQDGYGAVIDPKCQIKDVFKPGMNRCFVHLGPKFGRDCLPKQEISAFGVPKTYLSPFAQRAFYSITSSTLQKYDALKERVEKKEEEENSLVTRWEVQRASGKKQMTQEDVEASKFKAVMSDQSGFGASKDTHIDDIVALALVVDSAFQQMSMCRLGQITAADQTALKVTVVKWLDMIDNVFKFYSGMGADAGTATMSKIEFSHFIVGSKLFKDTSRIQQHIDECFKAANSEVGLAAKGENSGADNPDEELMRFEFLECLIRLSQIRYSPAGIQAEEKAQKGANSAAAMEAKLNALRSGRSMGATDSFDCELPMHETFEKVMSEFVKPSFEAKSTDSEVAQGLRSPEAQALFASQFDLLMVVYKHYACIDSEQDASVAARDAFGLEQEAPAAAAAAAVAAVAVARPSMNLQEFQHMIQDAGLSMTELDRTRVATRKKQRQDLDRRRRYARGNFEEPEEVDDSVSHDLTDTEIRQAFSCSQVR
jgi:hypothetical protein